MKGLAGLDAEWDSWVKISPGLPLDPLSRCSLISASFSPDSCCLPVVFMLILELAPIALFMFYCCSSVPDLI